MFDLIIIGGGPAGVAAGVYAARKKIKTLLIAEEFGGQSFTSANIENWIGTKSISGYDLAKNLEEHVRSQEGIEIADGDRVSGVEKKELASSTPLTAGGFAVKTRKGKTYETRFLLVAAGSHRRKLDVPGEKKLDGHGVVYCSTCDAPLFKGKTVAVVGGGNAGLEAAIDLFPYAAKIHLLARGEVLKGDPETQDKVCSHPNVEVLMLAQPVEIVGDQSVTGLKYLDKKTGETKELKLDGVFVEVGALPNSDIVKGLVNLNERGEIIVDHKTQASSNPGIWAVGDVSDVLYKQNNISAGDAVKAVLNIYEKLSKG